MSEHDLAIVIGLYLSVERMKDDKNVSRSSYPSMHGIPVWLTENLDLKVDEWRHDLVCFEFRYDIFQY